MRIKLFVLTAIFLASWSAAAEMDSPDDMAHQFYSWMFSKQGVGPGLPTKKEMEQLTQFISPRLLKLLDKAVVMEKQCIRNNKPGNKPRIIEGSIFVGNNEGATEVIVGQGRNEGKNIIVNSRLFSIDSRFPKSHKYRVHTWIDQLVLSEVRNKWVISNIKFKSGASLSSFLEEYITNGALWCNKKKK